MANRIPYPINDIEGIADARTRTALLSIRANLHTLYGVGGKRDDHAITKADLASLGFLRYDDAGNMVGQNVRAKPGLVDQEEKRVSDNSAVWISDVFDATDGVAAGAHTLTELIPANAYIIQSWYEVLTGFTGSIGATIALGIETDDVAGLLAPTLLAAGWTGTGVKAGIQDGAVANFSQKTTAERTLEVNVTGSLTGGRARIHVQYIVSE